MKFAQELEEMANRILTEARGRPQGLERMHLVSLADLLKAQANVERRAGRVSWFRPQPCRCSVCAS